MDLNYIQDVRRQETKEGQEVCGDVFLMERNREYTLCVLCDGIGSGVYANIAATTCASRLMSLAKGSMSTQAAATTVASSMHGARREAFPFAAFSVAKIFSDGRFTVHGYEFPSPVVTSGGSAYLPVMEDIQAGEEWIRETSGILRYGDRLILLSDGITEAGLGRGYTMGVGADYVCRYINRCLEKEMETDALADGIMELALEKSGGVWEDDSTLAVLLNRPGKKLVLMTGPPSNPSKDREYVLDGTGKQGWKVICGSSSADIVARELGRKLFRAEKEVQVGEVPEYRLEGFDVVSEGALVLNRVYNVLGDCPEKGDSLTVVEKICALMQKADWIEFLVGSAYNDAHASISFKEIGVMPRHMIVDALGKKLKAMGKLVSVSYY